MTLVVEKRLSRLCDKSLHRKSEINILILNYFLPSTDGQKPHIGLINVRKHWNLRIFSVIILKSSSSSST